MASNIVVWLIDDQEICNHLTENILKINKFSSEIHSFTDGQEALAALAASIETNTCPDYIFLDLNMPVLDGLGFIQAFQNFPKQVKDRCTLYILSSSIDEEEINKSKLYKDVRDFLIKPLDKKDIEVLKFQAEKVFSL